MKWFSNEKGYGFITSEGGTDHFFSVRSVRGADLPAAGDLVVFNATVGPKGPKAEDVVLASRAPSASGRNDRIECPGCERNIVPRIVTNRGTLDHSVCPFCGTTIEDFSLLGLMVKIVRKYPVFFLIVVVSWLALAAMR